MTRIVIALGRSANRRLRKAARQCEDAKLRVRFLILLNLDEGRDVSDTAAALGVHASTVRRVARRYQAQGVAGLIDRREENGHRKVDEDFRAALATVVSGSPTDYRWHRPTWTQELLCLTLQRQIGVAVSTSTMSRALRQIGARRGAPKPVVRCPWPENKRRRRVRQLRRLIEQTPPGELVFHVDEVDIHLNPKIGMDWMLPGQQKLVVTPGQNQKRYLAGARQAHSGELIWVDGPRKNSLLFLELLWKLVQQHRQAKVIHVILDNYSIHHTEQVRLSLATPDGRRLRLHFLPPYSPDDNAIERVWKDLHDNVTRNHQNATIEQLIGQVNHYLDQRNHDLAA
jgi:transposase